MYQALDALKPSRAETRFDVPLTNSIIARRSMYFNTDVTNDQLLGKPCVAGKAGLIILSILPIIILKQGFTRNFIGFEEIHSHGDSSSMENTSSQPNSLTRYAWLSIAAAIVTITLKASAYVLTGSVGLLSDAIESFVNLAAAIVALIALRILSRPANDEFSFGFSKVEYFSSGFEGGMILLAAASIIMNAIPRLIKPVPLEQVGLGLLISVIASLINLGVALVLKRAGKRYNSITLEADARHLMTDVWTTGGVLVGIALVQLTGFIRLDPLIAIAVAINIVLTGYRLLVRSGRGLMDVALPAEETAEVKSILDGYQEDGVGYHSLRSRQAAARKFMVVHLLVPGDWTVRRGHQIAEEIEIQIIKAVPNSNIVTHIEPAEDPISLQDMDINRG